MSQWVRKFDRNIPPLDYNDENLLTGVTHTREGKFTLKITLVRNLVKLPKGKYLSYIGTTKKILSRKIFLYFSASLLPKGKCRTYGTKEKILSGNILPYFSESQSPKINLQS